MDTTLRCNRQANGFCRKILNNWAIVTTCSHVFCRQCADQVGLTNANFAPRKCPACSTELQDEHDVVATNSKPTEEYKATVLSGLDPTTIMECAGRALAFWNYQMSEEIRYQEHISKALTERCGQLNNAVEKAVDDGNVEISRLSSKLEQMSVERNELLHKNHEIEKLYRDKSKRYLTVQKLYDTLKKKVQSEQQEILIAANADKTLQSLGVNPRPETYSGPMRADQPHRTAQVQHESLGFQKSVEILHPRQRSGSACGTHSDFDANVMPPPSIKVSRPTNHLAYATLTRRTPLTASRASRSTNDGVPIPVLGSYTHGHHVQHTSVSRPNIQTSHNPQRQSGSHQYRGMASSTSREPIGMNGVLNPVNRDNAYF